MKANLLMPVHDDDGDGTDDDDKDGDASGDRKS
jgi:hypothetical protein